MSTVVRSIAVCAMMLAVTSPALAQQPARPDAHHPPQGGAAAPGMTHGPGARRGEGHDMMAMCREMMGGMGPGGMGGGASVVIRDLSEVGPRMQELFAKLDVHRQSELVALLARLLRK